MRLFLTHVFGRLWYVDGKFMSKSAAILLLVISGALPIVAGVTKIAPTEAKPGEPFTIVDTDASRLVDGAVVLFVSVLDGSVREIALRTHKPFNTAQGRLPLSIPGGDYNVSVRQPSGNTFGIGPFHVIGAAPIEPTIMPTSGLRGTFFTITDPQGRMQAGDLAFFYPEGSNPALSGVRASNVILSADGKTLTGNVPSRCITEGFPHFVSVRLSINDTSRFGDLAFFVTSQQPEPPFIQPACGSATAQFTITDPQARMAGATIIVFFQSGQSPDQGTLVTDAVFSADGKTATGTVPAILPPGDYLVSVHVVSLNDPPIFNALDFAVTP